MIAISHQATNARGRNLGIFLSQEHRNLTCDNQIALAAFAVYGCGRNIEMRTNRLHNIVNGERLIVDFHRPLNHPFGQTHVDLAIIHHAISQQRAHHTF